MTKVSSSLTTEVEALKQAYSALNRNDVPGFVKIFAPEIERIEPADFPMGGTYRGLTAVTEHISKGRGTWAEGSCEPDRFVVSGDRIVVCIQIRVRLKTETEWREGRIADVFTFQNGKAIQFRTFGDEREGLEWAGVKELE
jgi:ketosteroid isomerase-like protein